MVSRRRRRPKLRVPEGIEAVLERAGDNRFAKHPVAIPAQTWTRAVGFRIADRAKPMVLERGVLTVRVPSSVWANELSMLASSVISRLRDAGVTVTELRFRVAPMDAPQRPPERRGTRLVPPPSPVPRDLEVSLSRIDDPELRDAIRLFASQTLAWQEHLSGARPDAPNPRASERESAPPGRRSRDGT